MSVLEEVRRLEDRVMARLAELRPLVEEYDQLRQVADRLGIDVNAAGTSRPAPRRSRRRAARTSSAQTAPARKASPRRSSRRRAPGGTKAVGAERRARVLELIGEHPGITVPDISRELGVEPPPLYRTVRKLMEEGAVKKAGKSLTLA